MRSVIETDISDKTIEWLERFLTDLKQKKSKILNMSITAETIEVGNGIYIERRYSGYKEIFIRIYDPVNEKG